MKKLFATLSILLLCGLARAELVSTNTRAATEVWVSRRFSPTGEVAEIRATLYTSTQAIASIQSALPGLATTGSLAAVSQLVSTGRVTRLHAASGTTMMDLSNTVPRVFSSGVFTNWTVVLSPTFSPRPWAGTTPHAFPFVLENWTGSFDGAGRASIFYNMGQFTWSSEEGYVSPQQLLSNDGGAAGFAVVSAVTTTRRNDAEILTDLTGYAKQSGTTIGEAYIQLAPDINSSLYIAHSGIVYYSLATGLATFTWPSDSGRLATTNDVEVAKAQAIAAIPTPDMSAKVDVTAGIATNLTTRGWFALPQSVATNLVLRLVSSNEHIYVEEVYQ